MRPFLLGIAICALTLLGCSAGDSDKRKALKEYNACVTDAAAKFDDGYSDAATVAKAISPKCAAEYHNVIQVNNPQNIKDLEAAMQAKQLGFATTIVADRRKSQSSN